MINLELEWWRKVEYMMLASYKCWKENRANEGLEEERSHKFRQVHRRQGEMER